MTADRRVDRARGALLGTFVGDALGMPYEGQPPDAVPDRLEMVAARRGRGTYTDDTQMTIALAESLVGRVASMPTTSPGHSSRPTIRSAATARAPAECWHC